MAGTAFGSYHDQCHAHVTRTSLHALDHQRRRVIARAGEDRHERLRAPPGLEARAEHALLRRLQQGDTSSTPGSQHATVRARMETGTALTAAAAHVYIMNRRSNA
jgi:hypothetical protein